MCVSIMFAFSSPESAYNVFTQNLCKHFAEMIMFARPGLCTLSVNLTPHSFKSWLIISLYRKKRKKLKCNEILYPVFL